MGGLYGEAKGAPFWKDLTNGISGFGNLSWHGNGKRVLVQRTWQPWSRSVWTSFGNSYTLGTILNIWGQFWTSGNNSEHLGASLENLHEFSMRFPLVCHGFPIRFPLAFLEFSMNVPLVCHQFSMNFQWVFHAFSMSLPFVCDNTVMPHSPRFARLARRFHVRCNEGCLWNTLGVPCGVSFSWVSIRCPSIYHEFSLNVPLVFYENRFKR